MDAVQILDPNTTRRPGSIMVEVTKATANKGRAAHLPHEPILDLSPCRVVLGKEAAFEVELVSQVEPHTTSL